MNKVIDGIKWLATGLWIALLSVVVASAILLLGTATLGDLVLRFFRKQ